MLNGVKYNSTKLYNQNKYIIDNIKDIATNYSSYLPKLYSIFSRLNGKNLKQLREAIYPYMTAYNANYTENRSNVVVNKEMTSRISFDTRHIMGNVDEIDDVYDKLIYNKSQRPAFINFINELEYKGIISRQISITKKTKLCYV